ncbi:MAG: SpoIIE family protein phosphatase, partial [Oscillospiraceae bacterium]|nr:SpoIIE family protein phosphatase [Oscillospiraceae bacterium]
MRIIRGIKLGGLQSKIFNLMLIFIALLIGIFVVVSVYQQNNLKDIVGEASREQQESIVAVSEKTMETVLETTMTRTTALQAYIAGDLFGDIRSDVVTLQAFAAELFEHAESFPDHPFSAPDAANDGEATAMVLHELGIDPDSSRQLGIAANMSEIMVAMFEASDKISGLFIGTADGNLLFVNDRAASYISPDGTPMSIDVRQRPWYTQAAEAGELIFTGVEADSYTKIATIECAAPVYANGELVAVVGADLFLDSISDYVETASANGGILCVVNEDGQVLFSPKKDGTFKPELSKNAQDLRENENAELAGFVREALEARTGLESITVDGIEYYVTGAPMETIGWTVISAVEKELTHQPTSAMLDNYEAINENALKTFNDGAKHSSETFIVATAVLVVLAIIGALYLAYRIVKPIEHMTERINSLSGSDTAFEMEDVYRTKDEIEVLAESFASLSKKTRDYIEQITTITAEKERIGTELALATRIQADMLPNIYPAFPDRAEFDIYATMDPAREVGGDFYDFFLIDDDHLCMLIADVSGKGVPAALFMMASRIILASNAKQGKSPAQILADTNATICQNNREEMFVTVWLGI